MKNKKLFVLILASSMTLASTAIIFTSINSKENGVLATETPTYWNHYEEVPATQNTHGSKEFWASCSEPGDHVFGLNDLPDGAIVSDGGDFSSTEYFDELEFFDDRYEMPLSYYGTETTEKNWNLAFDNVALLTSSNLKIDITFYFPDEEAEHKTCSFEVLDGKGASKYENYPSSGHPNYGQYVYDEIGKNINETFWSWNSRKDAYASKENVYPISKLSENISKYGPMRSFAFDDFGYSNGLYVAENINVETVDGLMPCKKCIISFINNRINVAAYQIELEENVYASGIELYSSYGEVDFAFPPIN